jgi:hypothetical protein
MAGAIEGGSPVADHKPIKILQKVGLRDAVTSDQLNTLSKGYESLCSPNVFFARAPECLIGMSVHKEVKKLQRQKSLVKVSEMLI